MTVLREGDLQIVIDDALNARRFDDESHGLSHCMKAVDIVVELPEMYLFMEFKDPDNPETRPENRREFIQEFQSGELDEELKYKYRDSFLYEWAAGRADKPVRFYVLVALEELTTVNLQSRTQGLRSKLPVGGPSSWIRPIAEDCAMFNLASWNERFPNFQVSRLSSQP